MYIFKIVDIAVVTIAATIEISLNLGNHNQENLNFYLFNTYFLFTKHK
jgi:hypothetical protein